MSPFTKIPQRLDSLKSFEGACNEHLILNWNTNQPSLSQDRCSRLHRSEVARVLRYTLGTGGRGDVYLGIAQANTLVRCQPKSCASERDSEVLRKMLKILGIGCKRDVPFYVWNRTKQYSTVVYLHGTNFQMPRGIRRDVKRPKCTPLPSVIELAP